MTRDERFISLAGECALKSTIFSRHGCILVVHGKPVSYGYNQLRNYSSDGIIQGFSCHAEMDALRNAVKRKVFLKRLPKSTMYITRLNRNGHYFDSKPCHLCYSQMLHYGIHRVVYTQENGEVESVRLQDYDATYTTKGSLFKQSLTI
jgi:deoxycytidylate deaminase